MRKTRKKAVADADDSPRAIAEQVGNAIEVLDAALAHLRPRDAVEAQRNSGTVRFADDLIAPTVTAATTSEHLKDRGMFDVERAQDAITYRDLMRPFAQWLRTRAAMIDFDIDARLAVSGREALAVYQWAKRMARSPDMADLRPFVEQMRKVVKREINRRPVKTAPASPEAVQGFHGIIRQEAEPPIDFDDLPEDYQELLRQIWEDDDEE
jgi:hypothetical protein